MFCRHSKLMLYTQLNLYIKATRVKGTWKCGLYEQLPFIYRLNLYALFNNGKNETVLYRQWLDIEKIEGPFKAGLTVPCIGGPISNPTPSHIVTIPKALFNFLIPNRSTNITEVKQT